MPVVGLLRGLGQLLLIVFAFPLWLASCSQNGGNRKEQQTVVVAQDAKAADTETKRKGVSSGIVVALTVAGAVLLLSVVNAGCAVLEPTATEREQAREWLRCARNNMNRQIGAVEQGTMTVVKARESAEWWIESSCGDTRLYSTAQVVRHYIK